MIFEEWANLFKVAAFDAGAQRREMRGVWSLKEYCKAWQGYLRLRKKLKKESLADAKKQLKKDSQNGQNGQRN